MGEGAEPEPDWAGLWSAQSEAIRAAWTSAQAASTDGADAALAGLWSRAAALSGELGRRIAEDEAGLIRRVLDPRQWMAASAGSGMTAGPGLGLADAWEGEQLQARAVLAWTALRQRTLEHQGLVLDAWTRAGQAFLETLPEPSAGVGPVEAERAAASWTEIGDRHLLETLRSEPFLASQRALLRADAEARLAQSALAEQLGRPWGMPTRTEMDDVHRTLTENRRELRALRRALEARTPDPAPKRRKTRST